MTESILFTMFFFMFRARQLPLNFQSHILKSGSAYVRCQDTLSLFFSDKYCGGEEWKTITSSYNCIAIVNQGDG